MVVPTMHGNESEAEATASGPVAKKRLATHFQNPPDRFSHNWAICGNASVLFGGPLTYSKGAVTCKACLRIMALTSQGS